jgi:TonB-linked SusC/RagA family outer membrane protein
MNTAPVITRQTDTRITGRAILKPVKGLAITGDYTFDRSTGNTDTYDKYAQGYNAAGAAVFMGTPGGAITKAAGFTSYMNYNLYAAYNYTLKEKHNFTLMAGMNNETSHFETFSAKTGNLIDPNNPSLTTGTSTTPAVSDNIQEYQNTGVFGRLDYDYKAKYLFQTSVRYDGSSKFPDGHRWVPAPAMSAGWRVLEENFMQWAKSYVNEFKLRGSYGTVGNQNIQPYQYQGVMPSAYTNWVVGGTKMVTVNQPGTLISPNFTWETVTSINFGTDLRFLKNRLTASFDWYDRKTTGILTGGDEQLPATLGTGAPLLNTGGLDSKGFEVQLGWRDQTLSHKVKYYATVNVSNYKSTITKVSNPTNIINNLYVGKRMGEIWGFVSDRLYSVDDFIPGTLKSDLTGGLLKPGISKSFNTATGTAQNPNVGDVMYKDLNGDGIVNTGNGTLANPGDRKIIGNSTPQYQFGINGGVSYAGFDFSFVLFGVGKQQQFILNSLTFPNYWSGQTALYANELDYWTPNNPQAHYARLYTSTGVPVGTGAPAVNQNVQTRYLLNTQYLRVKNLTLAYGIPKKWLEKISVSKLSFFYSLEDPFILSHLPKGVYPDISRAAASSSGSGGGQGYPMMRRSSVGLNLVF